MNDNETPDEIHGQLVQAQNLPPDLMLLKMENESIMAIARAKPRDPMAIVKQLTALIDAYPAAADEAIYVKPVGTVIQIVCGGCKEKYEVGYIGKGGVDCPKCHSDKIGSQKKVKKYAEGLSIRAAESIRSVYGFTRLSITMETEPDGKARIGGVFVDYCAGNITADARVVSPYYKSRNGTMERVPEDRFLNVIVKAEKAKLRRDIILDTVPNIVKAAFRDACEKKLELLISPKKFDEEVFPYFATKGINAESLEKIIGKPRSMGWTVKEMVQLRKIKAALENEETTASELLAGLDEQPAATPGPVAASDLTNPTAKKEEDKPEKKAEPKANGEPEKKAQDRLSPEARAELGKHLQRLGASEKSVTAKLEQFGVKSLDNLTPNMAESWLEKLREEPTPSEDADVPEWVK